jgi:hypothetical protein
MVSIGRQVTAILVLAGMPRLFAGAILAHECMHAWLRLRGTSHLDPQLEEGLCQLMAVLWLGSLPPAQVMHRKLRFKKTSLFILMIHGAV